MPDQMMPYVGLLPLLLAGFLGGFITLFIFCRNYRWQLNTGPHGVDKFIQFGPHDGFFFKETFRQFMQDIDSFLQNFRGFFLGVTDELVDLVIYFSGGVFGIVSVLRDFPA